MKRLLIILTALTLVCSTAARTPKKGLYTMDRLRQENPWLEGDNSAGYILNSFFLPDTVCSFTSAAIGAQYLTGSLRSIYEPESRLAVNAGIESHMRIRKVFLYSRFGYTYDHGQNSRWRGLTDPYRTPFMMADSIPGNTSDEIYSMSAGIAFPAGRHTALGLKASYSASLFSKHKDLRNKNTLMQFEIVPGFIYHTEKFRIGLNAGFRRITEEAEYIQIDEATEKYLFELYGLWLYRSLGYNSADHSRMLINSALTADLSLELRTGQFRLFNSFAADYDYGTQTETGYNGLRYGDTRTLSWTDRLILDWGPRHRVRAEVYLSRMLGYRFLQRQEYDPDSGVRIWKTYGSPINSYVQDILQADLNYTYRRAADFLHVDWELTAGAACSSFSRTVKEHPLYFGQSLTTVRPYLKAALYWGKGRSRFGLYPEAAYSHTLDGTENEVRNSTGITVSTDGTPLQLEGPLHDEYAFLCSSRVSAGAAFIYSLTLNRKGTVLHIRAAYMTDISTGGPLPTGTYRHRTSLSAGITF